MNPMAIATVHGIGARSERFTALAAVRRVPGVLAIYDVRCDGQHRLRMHRLAIRRVFAKLRHERTYDPRCQVVDAIVIVAELRELSFDFVVRDQASLVADSPHTCVADCRET